MSELDSSREGEQERWGAGKERGRRDMEVLTPDPKVWGRKGRAGRERPAFRRSPRRAAARAAVGGGAGGHSTWMPGPEGQLQALPTLPGSGPGGRPPQPRGPGRSYDGGAAAVRRGSQVSLDAPVRQGHVLPGGGGEGAGGALPWLTGLTPWMPVADCPPGQVPGGGHRVHAAVASFSLGRARPGQASGSCRPTASGGALGSRELVSGPGQQGAGRQPRGASLAPRAQGRAEPRQGPRGSGRPPPAQAAGGTGSASVSGFQLLLEARGLPRPSGPPPSPLHYPFPAFGFRSAWHARAICRKHSGITYGQTALARSLPVPPGRGAHTPAALGAAGDLPPRPRPPALLWAAWPLLSRPPSLQSPV